jgi:hypothetical protein
MTAVNALARTLNPPRPARVRFEGARPAGHPIEVNGERIESLRESWLVEDRWWTAEPLRRRYWELVGERGRNVVVFHDVAPAGRARGEGRLGAAGGWFIQSS